MAAQKKKQMKARFNAVDFLLLVLVLLSVVALFLRPTVLERIGKATASDTVVVSFYADRLTEEEYAMLTDGDRLTVDGTTFGELLSFSTQPYQTLQLMESDVQSENPFFEAANEPGLYTVKGQIRLTGARREDGFYAGGDLLVGVGSSYTVQTDSCVLTLQITGIA